MKIRTRFAPSPTGMMHVGNARTALVNKLFAMKEGGDFILRIDDTDTNRSTKEFENNIIQDLKWLGLDWHEIYFQSHRLQKYQNAMHELIASGRLYECYETPVELEIKRKSLLANSKPPIYDRSSLNLTEEKKQEYRASGRNPHYRFKLDGALVEWKDMIKGSMYFEVANISDPIVIKEDGSMTYMLCTCVDDLDLQISHVIRGEDHVSNTAIQIQVMSALDAKPPAFGHLSLIKSQNDKISKRVGGFDIASLRNNVHLEPMSINSLLANIGTKNPIAPYNNLANLVHNFDISNFGLSPTNYSVQDLEKINHKILLTMSYEDIKPRLLEMGALYITEKFWNVAKPNLHTLNDLKLWWDICYNYKPPEPIEDGQEVLKVAKNLLLDMELNADSWVEWTKQIKAQVGKTGRSIFMPLRLAITGIDHGPELSDLIMMIDKDEVIKRLDSAIKKSTA